MKTIARPAPVCALALLALGGCITIQNPAPVLPADRLPAAPEDRTIDGDLIAERYRPVVRIAREEPCGPIACEYMLRHADLVDDEGALLLKGPLRIAVGGRAVTDGREIVPLPPQASGRTFYLQYASRNGRSVSDLELGAVSEARTPCVYYTTLWFPGRSRFVVQYWMFYPYSAVPRGMIFGWPVWHQGDWEMMQIVFAVDRAAWPAPDVRPMGVTFSQHYYGQGLDWDDARLERRGDRPVVYVACGSHAAYPEPRDDFDTRMDPVRWPGDGASFVYPNDACGPVRDEPYRYELRRLPASVLAATLRWGEPGTFESASGPRGPGHRDERGINLHVQALDFHDRWMLSKRCRGLIAGGGATEIDLSESGRRRAPVSER